jgi:PAS domain S-box-containing protein
VTTRAALAIWIVALLAATGGAVLVLTSDHADSRAATIALGVPIGLAFIGGGLIAWVRRPENRTGRLMVLVGFAWFLGALSESNSAAVFTLGYAWGLVALGLLAHLLLAFPNGKLDTRASRLAAAGAYVVVFLLYPLTALFDPDVSCEGCPDNVLLIESSNVLTNVFGALFGAGAVVVVVALVVILLRRWHAAGPALRRALAPVFVTGCAFFLLLAASVPVGAASQTGDKIIEWLILAVFLAIPISFLLGLLGRRLARADVGRLLVDVPETPTPEEAQEGLRRALRDPTLKLAYWLEESESYVDVDGKALELEPDGVGRVTTRIEGDDGPIAALVHDASLRDEPELLGAVVAAARISIQKDRLQAELLARLDQLERERNFTATVVGTAPSFFCVVDPDGMIVRFNRTLEHATGLPDDEETRGRPFWDVFAAPEEADDVRRGLEAAAVGLAPEEFENQWLARNGERLVVAWSSTPILDELGHQRYLIAGLDVTRRKRQEEDLRASEERLRAVIQASPLALVEIHQDKRVKLWNRAAEDLFGWSAEEVIGKPLRIVPAGKEDESEELDRRAESEAYAGLETVRQRKDGSLVDVEVSMAPIRDAESSVVSFMAVYRDITERKRQERELQASRARIVQAGDAERQRLERNLHDGAQQRLVTLSLALRLAETRVETDADEARRILGGANEELALALSELRELARGIHPAVLTDRGLGPALEALAVRAPLPVELVGVPAQRLPEPVEAAAYYLVAEALTNVAKYAQASAVTVQVTRENGSAVVDIADNGIGGADPARGSGLRGLSDRVEALNGQLQVESPPGAGTRLRAEIPC